MSDVQVMKRCSTCKAEKPIETGFFKNRCMRDGIANACKDCMKKCRDKMHAADPSKRKEYHKKAWAKSGSVFNAKKKAKRQANIEAARKRSREKHAATKGNGSHRKSQAKYYKKNRDAIRARHAAYHAAHPEVASRSSQKRRALKAKVAIGDLQAIAAWEKTWRKAKSVPCHWWREIISRQKMSCRSCYAIG